jgi:G3E family GTPase
VRRERRMAVTVVTGGPGSGKSSVVRRLVDVAVADGEAVAVVSASLSRRPLPGPGWVVVADEEVVERSPGCPCCAVRHDLVRVLRNLGARRHRPSRVIVETSGVADVATIEQTLMGDPALRRLVVLDGILATVDATAWSVRVNVEQPPDPAVEEQVALADVVVVIRAQHLTDEGVDAVTQGLRDRNPLGRIVLALPGQLLPRALLDVARTDAVRLADRLEQLPIGRIGSGPGGLDTFVLSVPGPLDAGRTREWVKAFSDRHGPALLRFHAVLALAPGEGPGERRVYRGLRGHLQHSGDRRLVAPPALDVDAWAVNRLAITGRGLDADEVRSSLADCVVGGGG